jgi:SAM-dependent methyltransferase
VKASASEHTPLYGRLLIRLIKPFPNFDFSFIKPVRRRAVESLRLPRSGRVLDVGCGPGGSFPFLVEAVGPEGSVVGIEISPMHASIARDRVKANGWKNVEVVTTPARDADIAGLFDGLLMFAAPDVYGSDKELGAIIPHLNEGARVAAFGGKLSGKGVGKLLNPILKLLYNLSFSTTPRPEEKPWSILAAHLDDITIEEYFFGLMFLLSGTVKK